MTVSDLICNLHFRLNQTFLAKTLNVNRGTLRRYLKDKKGQYHFVKVNHDLHEYELFTNQSKKIQKED